MSVGIGSKSSISYVVETTYGVIPASPAGTEIPIVSESLQNTRNSFASKEVNPSRQVTSVRMGNVSAQGDIDVQFSPNVCGELLKHLLMTTSTDSTLTPSALAGSTAYTRGTYVTSNSRVYLCVVDGTSGATITGGLLTTDYSYESTSVTGTAQFQYYAASATPLYKHVLAAGTTKPVGGFTVEKMLFLDTGAQYFQYIGGRVDSLSLKVPQEGMVTGKWSMVFLNLVTPVTSASIYTGVTTPADDPFAGADAVMYILPPGGSYTSDFSISDFSCDISNNFDSKVYAMGQRQRRDLPENTRMVKGSFTAYFENVTKFNEFVNENTLGIKVGLTHNGQYLEILIPQVRLTGGTPVPNISGNGVLTQSFNFEGFNNTGSGSDVTVTLINSTTTY